MPFLNWEKNNKNKFLGPLGLPKFWTVKKGQLSFVIDLHFAAIDRLLESLHQVLYTAEREGGGGAWDVSNNLN
jgi:hypothetical protein